MRYILERVIEDDKSTFVGRIQVAFSFMKLKPSHDDLFRLDWEPVLGDNRALCELGDVLCPAAVSSYNSTSPTDESNIRMSPDFFSKVTNKLSWFGYRILGDTVEVLLWCEAMCAAIFDGDERLVRTGPASDVLLDIGSSIAW